MNDIIKITKELFDFIDGEESKIKKIEDVDDMRIEIEIHKDPQKFLKDMVNTSQEIGKAIAYNEMRRKLVEALKQYVD